MYHLNFLNRENDLNKVIKIQKKSKKDIKILFISLWDKWSQDLVDSLKSKYSTEDSEDTQPVYIVDSFSMPHSFVIFNTRTVPCLVSLNKDKVVKEDRLPLIYKELLQHAAYSKV